MTDLLSKSRLQVLRDTFTEMTGDTSDKFEREGWIDAAKVINEVLQRREAAEKPAEYKVVDPFGEITLRREKCEAEMYREMEGWKVTDLFTAPLLSVVSSTQDAVAWMVVRDGDPTFPRLFKLEEEADFIVKRVELNPKAVKVPLGPLQALPVVPDEAIPENIQALSGVLIPRNGGWHKMDESDRYMAVDVWNACRGAMLQPGNSPATPDE
ncbi:hypothetical protein [Pectobacterium parvum]|uniref:hypothetical protein n=1 Tax=Pectobacterium parvum TaxID=2778550 RepID=UPI002159377A|nr:hypothetical protein [Pectobacterium parvum]UVD99354.1 hypothetical protein NV347_10385 [Pectobacterium parvum]